jgi:hypothetical protein
MAVSSEKIGNVLNIIRHIIRNNNMAEGVESANIHDDTPELDRLHWRSSEYPVHMDAAFFEFLVDCGRL